MSKRHRKRAVHHEDIDVLGLALNAALHPVRRPAPVAVTKPTAKPLGLASAVMQAITPSVVKSGAAAVATGKAGTTALTPPKAISPAAAQKALNATAKISSSTSRLRASAQKNKKLSGKLTSIAKALDNKAAKVKQAAQMRGGSSM